MSIPHGAHLFDPLMVEPRVGAALSDIGFVRSMLEVEAALARAEAAEGVIPHEAATAIGVAVDTMHEDDVLAMAAAVTEGAARAGSPVIPFVRLLAARTAQEGQPFVHWGATTQDIMDTALVLQLRAVSAIMEDQIATLADALAALALAHRDTPMIARTVMQHALPTTFGLKAAGWLTAALRLAERFDEWRPRALALQFGGAAGTLASLGTKGPAVAAALARDLGLANPQTPWHAARDRIAETGALCGLICGALGKIGRDVTLLMQTDVQEAFEPMAPGRGGSSTMPHKRNPVLSAVMTGAGVAAPGLVATLMSAQMHEHERAAGAGHAEWRSLPELLRITSGALQAAVALAEGLEVRQERMRANIDATNGLVMAEAVMMALGATLGRLEAHHLVEEACRRAAAQGQHLRDVLAQDPQVGAALPAERLAALFEPESYLGAAGHFVDAALAAHASRARREAPPSPPGAGLL